MSIESLHLVSVRMPAEGEGQPMPYRQACLILFWSAGGQIFAHASKQQALHHWAMLSAQRASLQVKTVSPRTFWIFRPHYKVGFTLSSFCMSPSVPYQGTAQHRGPYLELSLALSETSGSQVSHSLSPHVLSRGYPPHTGWLRSVLWRTGYSNSPQQEVDWEEDVLVGWGKKGDIEETKARQMRTLGMMSDTTWLTAFAVSSD